MCFHNSMSAKAIKVAARYGRQSDVVEIYQSILDEQYHVNAFTFPRYPIITSSDEEVMIGYLGKVNAFT